MNFSKKITLKISLALLAILFSSKLNIAGKSIFKGIIAYGPVKCLDQMGIKETAKDLVKKGMTVKRFNSSFFRKCFIIVLYEESDKWRVQSQLKSEDVYGVI